MNALAVILIISLVVAGVIGGFIVSQPSCNMDQQLLASRWQACLNNREMCSVQNYADIHAQRDAWQGCVEEGVIKP